MVLAAPSPSPSPIDINVTVSMPPISIPPDAALDNYTRALATWTETLAILTLGLVVITLGLATIGGMALWFQRREIKHTAEQLTLTRGQLALSRQQFEAARKAARPDLEVGVAIPTASVIQTSVTYIAGSDPAYDVSVGLRSVTGYFALEIGTVAPGRQRTFMFPSGFRQLDDEAITNMWPFASAREALEANNHVWAGIVWHPPDRTERRHLRLFAGHSILVDLRDKAAK